MKYFVIATRWDDERKAQVKYIAGQFYCFAKANFFKPAYKEHYTAFGLFVLDLKFINHYPPPHLMMAPAVPGRNKANRPCRGKPPRRSVDTIP